MLKPIINQMVSRSWKTLLAVRILNDLQYRMFQQKAFPGKCSFFYFLRMWSTVDENYEKLFRPILAIIMDLTPLWGQNTEILSHRRVFGARTCELIANINKAEMLIAGENVFLKGSLIIILSSAGIDSESTLCKGFYFSRAERLRPRWPYVNVAYAVCFQAVGTV